MTRILMLLPTLKRPEQAVENLKAWSEKAGQSDGVSVEYVIAADWNDPTVECLLDEATSHFDASSSVRIAIGPPAGKIGGTNRELPGFDLALGMIRPGVSVRDYADIVIAHSDDMWPGPESNGWAETIASVYREKDPNFDSVLWCHDGYQDRLLTWPVLGAGFLDRLRYIYSDAYKTECADDDLHLTAARWGKLIGGTDDRRSRHWHRAWRGMVDHRHPAHGQSEMDENYAQNLRRDWQVRDREVFAIRKPGLGVTAPEAPTLSILVPSVTEREAELQRLLRHLNASGRGLERGYEVIVDRTPSVVSGGPSIGQKRQRLLQWACGEYVCFVDDDDTVHPLYVSKILSAIAASKAVTGVGPDVIGFDLMREDVDRGGRYLYRHSLSHPTTLERHWVGPDPLIPDGYAGVRPPNHLNPVRRELALEVGFTDSSWGEDSAYSRRIFRLLRHERFIGGEPLYVYHDSRSGSVAAKSRG